MSKEFENVVKIEVRMGYMKATIKAMIDMLKIAVNEQYGSEMTEVQFYNRMAGKSTIQFYTAKMEQLRSFLKEWVKDVEDWQEKAKKGGVKNDQ